jgi:F-type H+-transporting ATPase subunit a
MAFRTLISTFVLFLLSGVSFAGGDASAQAETHHGLPQGAVVLTPDWFPLPITNSMVMVWIVVVCIVVVCQMGTRKMRLVPSGLQNFVEWAIESLYLFVEGILGEHMTKKTFWFFSTVFIMILCVNWFGLIPGVGTIGWKDEAGHMVKPLLRGGNADLNLTMAMSALFALLWIYWAVAEIGVKGVFLHIFAPKGDFNGFMKVFMLVVFGFVGVIEVVSIMIRPVALTFRLYGNIFAGENMLEGIMLETPKYLSWLSALPFYFMELLVGLIQALVFMLLTVVFLKLICDHDEEEATEGGAH